TFNSGSTVIPTAFSATNLRLSVNASFAYTKTGNDYIVSNTGTSLQVSADSLVAFPNVTGGPLFSVGSVTGSFDASGHIGLTAATATANVGGLFALTMTNVQFYLGTDATRDRVSVGSVSATFSGLTGVTITLTGFRVSNGGFFGIDSASAN